MEIRDFKFSYNSLNKLSDVPSQFYKEYILGEREKIDTKYFTEGELIHYLILQRDKSIDDKYVVMDDDLPSPNAITIIESIFELDNTGELDDHGDEINTRLESMNLYQSVKDYDKRIAKICDDKGRKYWNFLKESRDKKAITSEMLVKCISRTEKVLSNNDILSKIGALDESLHVYNEYPIELERYNKYADAHSDEFKVGLKGIIDNFVVDEEHKVVTINDFKTTSKKIQDFPSSVNDYNYWMQAAIYHELIRESMELDMEWRIEFNFIVFDRNDSIYAYHVNHDTMLSWLSKLDKTIENAVWSIMNERYDLPYEFANGCVEL